MVVMVARRRWRRGNPVPAVAVAVARRWGAMPPGACKDRSREGESGDERDHEFLGHGTPSFLSLGLVCKGSDDAADHGSSEDGPAVRLVMLNVNDPVAGRRRRRRGWRRCRMSHGCGVVDRSGRMMFRDFVTVFLRRFRGRCLLMRGRRPLAAARGGCRQSRSANRHTRKCRDCHCLDHLVHVTPTFPGFLPLHQVRGERGRFLTGKIHENTFVAQLGAKGRKPTFVQPEFWE